MISRIIRLLDLELYCAVVLRQEDSYFFPSEEYYDNDLLTALAADQETALEPVFKRINKEEKGVIIFINRKQTPDNLLARIQALDALQKEGEFNTVPPMAMDERDFGIGAQILHDLNVKNLRVLTNSDIKNRVGLHGYGLNIVSNETY